MQQSPSKKLSSSISQEILHILQDPKFHKSLPLANTDKGYTEWLQDVNQYSSFSIVTDYRLKSQSLMLRSELG